MSLDFDIAAAVAHNAKALGLGVLPDNTEARLAIALAFWQEEHGLEPDGAYDRATEESLNTARHDLEGVEEPEPVIVAPPAMWPPFNWGIPKGTPSALVLGIPGPSGSAWHRANIVDLRGLDERKTKSGEPGYTGVHKICAPALTEAIRRARLADPGYRIKVVGGYVYRRIRHSKNPNAPLSKHSFGAAFDINSNDNFSKTFGVNEDGPEPWTDEWNDIWKHGITRPVVEAIESVGWTWGGRWRAPKGKRGFRDPMHFQAPKKF